VSERDPTVPGREAEETAGIDSLREENERLRSELEACRQLTSQVISAEDQGRRRIAQLIHDDSLQALLAANQELIEAAPGRAQVTRAHEVVEGTIARLREAMMALHPVTLEEGGLQQALGAVARQAARQGGFEIAVEIDEAAVDLHDELILAVARELLTNAARHSGASRVSVALTRDRDLLELRVADDGRGFTAERRAEALAEGHIGLASISQRMRGAGGTLDVSSSPDGTVATARLPLGSDGRG
jgi:two-component system NarL family sensor kinase